ncbi:hypothetical protein AMAG_01692 [Allomyces macrogynus ATCC 38327]|uniref:Uncharacterized protein n=1 Tax=Allomyces macrogynus (strain ATCC 38327) TaxID=578462 RepID=A0A0L0S0F5_ALLM3|nr:hypothetical protein AMAG_01692 [Allomyces macrogynus ATCC 38327]|eukprot:KNE55824.1 hypothetical protein AMAG_01692 [Allomyces macrogynus ATCC 38327]
MDGTAPGPVRITRVSARAGPGSFFANDEVADTLYPLLEPLFTHVPHMSEATRSRPSCRAHRAVAASSRVCQIHDSRRAGGLSHGPVLRVVCVLAHLAQRRTARPVGPGRGDSFVRRVAKLKDKVRVRRTAKTLAVLVDVAGCRGWWQCT